MYDLKWFRKYSENSFWHHLSIEAINCCCKLICYVYWKRDVIEIVCDEDIKREIYGVDSFNKWDVGIAPFDVTTRLNRSNECFSLNLSNQKPFCSSDRELLFSGREL